MAPSVRRSRWLRARHVLGINARNLLYVHGLNRRRHFPLADDKVRTKAALEAAGIPVPETLAVLSSVREVSRSRTLLERTGEFVIKPARGRRGGGILILTGRDAANFLRPAGAPLLWEDLRRAMGDILFGVHSAGRPDRILVERRVRPEPGLGALGEMGLPDVRVILVQGRPAMAMMRVPTRASGGKANLHRGAVGVAVRLTGGEAFRAVLNRHRVERHPDTDAPLIGFRVPFWSEAIDLARRTAGVLPLPYLGVDIVLAEGRGPLIMEVNVRPGLEIQNVNGRGLRRLLERVASRAEGGL